jgi:Ca2+-binding EF-hand superfamily protein
LTAKKTSEKKLITSFVSVVSFRPERHRPAVSLSGSLWPCAEGFFQARTMSTLCEEVARQTALKYKSYIANRLSSNTIHTMLQPENFAKADADGGGTLDKEEFGTLLTTSGVDRRSAHEQAMLLFMEADEDGDGELTVEEIKNIVAFKKSAAVAGASTSASLPSAGMASTKA